MRKILFALAVFFFGIISLKAQISENYKKALSYLDNGQYELALRQLENDLPTINFDILIIVGKCHFHTNNLIEAERFFRQAYNLKNARSNAAFWLGRTAHCGMKYAEAIKWYKSYLSQNDGDQNNKAFSKHAIKQCGNAMKWEFKPQLGYVEKLDLPINTIYDEFSPVFSPSFENRIYFSSNRVTSGWEQRDQIPFASTEIYVVEFDGSSWSEPFYLNESLNTDDHEILLDISPNGQSVWIFQPVQKQIVVDTFSTDSIIRRGLFDEYIHPENGDQYIQVINDSTLLFSANRPDTYGGLDIYVLNRKEGRWQDPINLGDNINSHYNEISPFLTPDQSTLYFSSDRPDGIGGFDIFMSEFDNQSQNWTSPQNVYAPVNSPLDDLQFRISASGNSAIFSSDRKQGFGGFDLYMLYLTNSLSDKMQPPNQITFSENYLQADNSEWDPVQKQRITIPYLLYGEDDFILTSINIKKLEKLINLLKANTHLLIDIIGHTEKDENNEFDLFFSIKRSEKIKEYLVNNGIQAERIFTLGAGSDFPIAKNMINDVFNPSGQKFNRRIDFRIHDSSNKFICEYEMPQIVRQFQDTTHNQFSKFQDGLTYKIFVASTNLPNVPTTIKNAPYLMIEKKDNESDYDYTVGLEKSFFDANILRNELRKQGISDATIYAYVNGRRLSPDEIDTYLSIYQDLVYFQHRTEE